MERNDSAPDLASVLCGVIHAAAISVLAAMAAACGAGSGEGLDTTGRPLGETTLIPLAATFESIQSNILTPTCAISGCHTGSTAPLGLTLDINAYDLLVGASSVQQPAKLRVNPGNADNSYLIQKLEGAAGISGLRMPRNAAPLPASTIGLIREWIDAGAQRDTGAGVQLPQPPRVTATEPADGETVNHLPAAIQLTFSTDLDGATIADQITIFLQAAGGDSGFNEGNEIDLTPLPASLDSLQPNRLTLDLSGFVDSPDVYRILLKGSGPSVIRDLSANQVLDGDADGVAGGDFTATFTVDPTALIPTLESLQAQVFDPPTGCAKSGCHSGVTAPHGLNLSAGQSFDSLVNVDAVLFPQLKRVAPGDPDNSALIHAIESPGAIMPFDNPGSLPQSTVDVIRLWISQGAKP